MTGIYRVINKVNGKSYVGQTLYLEKRFQEHMNDSNSRLLKQDVREYGSENFDYEILAECNVEDLNRLEKEFVAKFKADDPDHGYNIYSGGGHRPGFQHSEETKKILRSFGPKLSGEKNPFYGKHHTEETKQKIRDHMPDTTYNWRGKHHSEESRVKMRGPRPSFAGENNHSYGKRGKDSYLWGYRAIHKGDVGKRVKPEDLQQYLDDGWVLGNRPNLMTEEKRKMYSDAGKGHRLMNKNGTNKFIKPDEFENYLNDGWVFGRATAKMGE